MQFFVVCIRSRVHGNEYRIHTKQLVFAWLSALQYAVVWWCWPTLPLESYKYRSVLVPATKQKSSAFGNCCCLLHVIYNQSNVHWTRSAEAWDGLKITRNVENRRRVGSRCQYTTGRMRDKADGEETARSLYQNSWRGRAGGESSSGRFRWSDIDYWQ